MDRPVPAAGWSQVDWRAIADEIPHIVWVIGPNGDSQYTNQRGEDYTGASGSASWEAVIHPDDVAGAAVLWEQAVSAKLDFEADFRLRRRDGAYLWHILRAHPQLDAEGHVERWVGTATDIHDRKQLEQHLIESRLETVDALNLLDNLHDAAPVGLGFVDRDLRIARINEEQAGFTRHPRAQMVGMSVEAAVPELWGQLEPVYRHVLDAGEAVRNLPFTRTEDEGRPRQEWLASFYPVRTGEEVIGVGVVTIDVTERLQAQEFRSTVMSQVSDGVYTLDGEGLLRYMNRAASKMLGWTEDELCGLPMHEVIHFQRADGSLVAAEDCALVSEGSVHRLIRTEGEVFTRKDGSIFPVAFSAMPLAVGSTGEGVSVVFRDLSDPSTATNLIRVLVADPDPTSGETLTAMLTRHEGVEVVGVARTSGEAVEQAVRQRADVVIVDVGLPDVGGVATALRLKAAAPATSILMLVDGQDEAVAAAAIAAGCSGVVDKRRVWVELASAVRATYHGETTISPAQLQAVVTKVRASRQPGRAEDLTAREREVLLCLTQGLTNQQAATRLGGSVNTVRNHVQRILYKLDAHSRLEAVVVATRDGLLEPPG